MDRKISTIFIIFSLLFSVHYTDTDALSSNEISNTIFPCIKNPVGLRRVFTVVLTSETSPSTSGMFDQQITEVTIKSEEYYEATKIITQSAYGTQESLSISKYDNAREKIVHISVSHDRGVEGYDYPEGKFVCGKIPMHEILKYKMMENVIMEEMYFLGTRVISSQFGDIEIYEFVTEVYVESSKGAGTGSALTRLTTYRHPIYGTIEVKTETEMPTWDANLNVIGNSIVSTKMTLIEFQMPN